MKSAWQSAAVHFTIAPRECKAESALWG